MIINLPYRPIKKLPFTKERPVEVRLRIGTLEDLCEELKIEFWQIKEYMTENDFDFLSLLLYRGYITACEKRYQKPKYDKDDSIFWYEHMSMSEKTKFVNELSVLFGKLVKAYKPESKKKATKQPSGKLESLPLES